MQVRLGVADDRDWSLVGDQRTLNGADVTAAYFRRPGLPQVDARITDPGERAYCEAEWAALLKSIYLRLGKLWLNSPAAIGLAEDKPRQLVLARQLGFRVPKTLITNDPAALGNFVGDEASVAKPLREALLDGDSDRVIFTDRIDRAVARDEASIQAAPLILQHEVVKAADIRVTVVGNLVFAAAIHSQAKLESEVDWRRGDTLDLVHRAVELPVEIASRCVRIVAELGLTFGAIDLVEDRDGQYWFLECNPNGQWAWIETRTGSPIAAAIVDHLAGVAGHGYA